MNHQLILTKSLLYFPFLIELVLNHAKLIEISSTINSNESGIKHSAYAHSMMTKEFDRELRELNKREDLISIGYSLFSLDQILPSLLDISRKSILYITNEIWVWNTEVTLKRNEFVFHQNKEVCQKLAKFSHLYMARKIWVVHQWFYICRTLWYENKFKTP